APVLAPSGVDEHGITRLQAYPLLLQRLLQIGYSNLVVDWQDLHTLETRDVDQHTTRHQGADLLHTHLGEAAAARDLVHLDAVIEQPIDRLMGEAIELRTDLTDLRDNHLLVAVALVRSEWTGAALGMHIVLPTGIERHVPSQDVSQFEGLARLEQLWRWQHVGRLHVIARPAFIRRAPFRGASLVRRRWLPALGDGVRR